MEPARTSGGTRRYSGAEVDYLREISALADAGVNIAGMRRIVDLNKTVRMLRSKLSAFEALKEETLRLKAEIASLKADAKRSRRDSRKTT